MIIKSLYILFIFTWQYLVAIKLKGGARGVMVILAGNGLGHTSSNPRRD